MDEDVYHITDFVCKIFFVYWAHLIVRTKGEMRLILCQTVMFEESPPFAFLALAASKGKAS